MRRATLVILIAFFGQSTLGQDVDIKVLKGNRENVEKMKREMQAAKERESRNRSRGEQPASDKNKGSDMASHQK